MLKLNSPREKGYFFDTLRLANMYVWLHKHLTDTKSPW